MGAVNSTGNKLEKALASDLPEDERYFGLENFGNTCYCNSVLQALYFCEPFRTAVLDYARNRRGQSSALPEPAPRSAAASNNVSSHASVASFLTSATTSSSAATGAATATGASAGAHTLANANVPNGSSGFRNAVKGVVALGGHAYSAATNSHPPAASATAAPHAASNSASAAAAPSAAGTGTAASASGSTAAPTDCQRSPADDDTMLTALADLFSCIASQKKRTGSVPPKSFVNKLRQENELFSTYMHQDAHEFLNFILNNIVECLHRDSAQRRQRKHPTPVMTNHSSHVADNDNSNSVGGSQNHHHAPEEDSEAPDANGKLGANGNVVGEDGGDDDAEEEDNIDDTKTFIHDLFEGQLSNEVRCLCCETVTRRVESFFDLSVDVEQNSSLTACLRSFSSTELLEKQDKFFCDACCSLQEAERRMRVKLLPRILALHLKRFKYVEQQGKYKKLSYRVVFPLELRLYNTSDDAEDPDRLYALFAVVVHVGSGPNQGHYVSLIKSHGQWLLFDDDCVEPKDESEIQSVYGITQDSAQSTEAGYILFYEQTCAN